MPEHNWYPPLNLIWLATYLEASGHEVEILDGQLLSLQEILDKVFAQVVGVSFDILSTREFDTIVREAKARGCYTVAGGHLATALAPSLLRRNPDLDAVVRHDGEESLLGIAQSIDSGGELGDSIPNVSLRRDGRLVQTPEREVDLESLPVPRRDAGGISLRPYFANFQRTKSELDLRFKYERPTNAYSHKGCPFRVNGKGCSFCSRMDTHLRQKTAAQVYEEYRYLADNCEVDHISDFSDSWISAPFVRALAEQYWARGAIAASLRVYGDVRCITEENAKLMRELGVDTVLLGIESGNEDILRQNGKPIMRHQILAAVRTLAKWGIKVADAYVLGLIGETWGSVRDTINLFREIGESCETEITYWNIMTPLPGSRVWNLLLERGAIIQDGDYHVNIEELERIGILRLCDLGPGGYDRLRDVRERMLLGARTASAEFVPRVRTSLAKRESR
jgi:radical SAM superfamily enzyme YgiQ (UPF0313 family)